MQFRNPKLAAKERKERKGMWSAPAPGAAGDALVGGFCMGSRALMGSSLRVTFGAGAQSYHPAGFQFV